MANSDMSFYISKSTQKTELVCRHSTETFSKDHQTQINSKDLESQLTGARLDEVQELKNGPPGTNPTGGLSAS